MNISKRILFKSKHEPYIGEIIHSYVTEKATSNIKIIFDYFEIVFAFF